MTVLETTWIAKVTRTLFDYKFSGLAPVFCNCEPATIEGRHHESNKLNTYIDIWSYHLNHNFNSIQLSPVKVPVR